MTLYIFGFPLPDLTPTEWALIIFGVGIWFYVLMNYVVRRRYIRVGYFDDGEGFDIFNCEIIGNQVEFFPESIPKLYGIVPLAKRTVKDKVRKDIAAAARTWVRGPRTFKLYFCSYNSPVTIDPTKQELDSIGLSLGHETVKSMLGEVAISGKSTSRADWFIYVLLIICGMFLHIMLELLIPSLRPVIQQIIPKLVLATLVM